MTNDKLTELGLMIRAFQKTDDLKIAATQLAVIKTKIEELSADYYELRALINLRLGMFSENQLRDVLEFCGRIAANRPSANHGSLEGS